MEVKRRRFSKDDDLVLLRLVRNKNPFLDTLKWKDIQVSVEATTGKPFSCRALKDHLNLLLQNWKKNAETNSGIQGIEGVYSEHNQLLQEIFNMRKNIGMSKVKLVVPRNVKVESSSLPFESQYDDVENSDDPLKEEHDYCTIDEKSFDFEILEEKEKHISEEQETKAKELELMEKKLILQEHELKLKREQLELDREHFKFRCKIKEIKLEHKLKMKREAEERERKFMEAHINLLNSIVNKLNT